MKFLIVFAFVGQLMLFHHCQASLVGWILGRDSSPFSSLSSDKKPNDVIKDNQPAEEGSQQEVSDSSPSSNLNIPFELSIADEKFISDAQKYTDLKLSELDVCQHKVRSDFTQPVGSN